MRASRTSRKSVELVRVGNRSQHSSMRVCGSSRRNTSRQSAQQCRIPSSHLPKLSPPLLQVSQICLPHSPPRRRDAVLLAVNVLAVKFWFLTCFKSAVNHFFLCLCYYGHWSPLSVLFQVEDEATLLVTAEEGHASRPSPDYLTTPRQSIARDLLQRAV